MIRMLQHWMSIAVQPRVLTALARIPRYLHDWYTYAALPGGHGLRLRDSHPCLTDWVGRTSFDHHYFHQGAWLARRLSNRPPWYHVDIGSSVMTLATVSAYVPTLAVEYRPFISGLNGLDVIAGDATRLPFADASLSSISSLHVVEHIGLGRYGDALDPDGWSKALREMARILAPGGVVFLSVPVGRERVCFNAHRVFSPRTLLRHLSELELVEFSYVDDSGRMHENVSAGAAEYCEYGCGLYMLARPHV